MLKEGIEKKIIKKDKKTAQVNSSKPVKSMTRVIRPR